MWSINVWPCSLSVGMGKWNKVQMPPPPPPPLYVCLWNNGRGCMSCGNPGALWAVYESPLLPFTPPPAPPAPVMPDSLHLADESLLWRAWATVRNKITTVTQDVKEFRISQLVAYTIEWYLVGGAHITKCNCQFLDNKQRSKKLTMYVNTNSEAKQQQSVWLMSALPSNNLQSVEGWWMDHDSLWAVVLIGEVWAGAFMSSASCRGERSSLNEASENQRHCWATLVNCAHAEACVQGLRYLRYCLKTHSRSAELSGACGCIALKLIHTG